MNPAYGRADCQLPPLYSLLYDFKKEKNTNPIKGQCHETVKTSFRPTAQIDIDRNKVDRIHLFEGFPSTDIHHFRQDRRVFPFAQNIDGF